MKVRKMVVNHKIIERLKRKDEEAFELVYYEYSNLIYYIAFSITKNREDSEEVLQDTFINMFNSIENYKESNKFKQWLMQIARNLSYNKVSRNKEINNIRDEEYINTLPAKNEEIDLILTIKGILDMEASNIVILRIVYNLTFKEIAEECNMSLSMVQSIYYQSLKKLKKEFKYE